MKKTITFMMMALAVYSLATAQTFDWARSEGGPGLDKGISMAVDHEGNVYSTGFFEGIVDFDPNIGGYYLYSFGSTDAFIQKLDASATPYDRRNARGDKGQKRTISFTVIDSNSGARIADTDHSMNLYPNPTQTKFTLDLANVEAGKLEVQVYNVNGILVRQHTENVVSGAYTQTMSLLNLPAGLYIVKVLNGEHDISRKILKF